MVNLNLAFVSCMALLVSVVGMADVIVVPNANTNTPGNSNGTAPSSPTDIIAQELFGPGQFTSVGAIDITGFSFRADPGTGPVDWTIATVDVYVSTSPNSPSSMSTTFANNIGPDNTLVFSGTNVTLSDAGCSGPGVCPFDMSIAFTTPFDYNPANGSLLAELVATGFVGTGFNDAVEFSGPENVVARVVATGSTTATTGTLGFGNSITEFTFTPVPEPACWLMTASAAALLWMGTRRRARKILKT